MGEGQRGYSRSFICAVHPDSGERIRSAGVDVTCYLMQCQRGHEAMDDFCQNARVPWMMNVSFGNRIKVLFLGKHQIWRVLWNSVELIRDVDVV